MNYLHIKQNRSIRTLICKKKRTCQPFVFVKILRFSLWHSYGGHPVLYLTLIYYLTIDITMVFTMLKLWNYGKTIKSSSLAVV